MVAKLFNGISKLALTYCICGISWLQYLLYTNIYIDTIWHELKLAYNFACAVESAKQLCKCSCFYNFLHHLMYDW